MDELTLREVCNRIGVSRRAVQGYETAGLVNATHKNERGYLLYDEKAQSRIRKIKLFQNMGFSIKEIKSLMDVPATVLKEALEEFYDAVYEDAMEEVYDTYYEGIVKNGKDKVLYGDCLDIRSEFYEKDFDSVMKKIKRIK